MNKAYSPTGSYEMTLRRIHKACGAEMTKRIAVEASELYDSFLPRHRELHGVAKLHWVQCCERAAIYLVIEKHFPGKGLEWVDLSVKALGEKMSAVINATLKLPPMRAAFIPLMKRVAGGVFGKKGGFENRFVFYNGREAGFDIISCPYCKYLAELGCPELTANFCNSDLYAYGDLSEIEFSRTQTLGTGGEKCDFVMRRR